MERDTTLDLAKGVLITLVVLGHAIQYSFGVQYTQLHLFFSNIVYKAIYSFHMPLFMLISGYLFYISNKKRFIPLTKRKITNIGLPFLSFVLLCKMIDYTIHFEKWNILTCFLDLLITILRGSEMWFLYSLLLNMLIVSLLTRIIKKTLFQHIAMLMLFICSFFVPDNLILSSHKYMFPFFCIGYIIKEKEILIYTYSKNSVVMGVLTIASILAINWFDRNTYIYTTGFCIIDEYSNQLFINIKRIIIALIVSITVMQYINKLSVINNKIINFILIRLGKISLFIYGFNVLFDSIYVQLQTKLSININFNYFVPIIFTIVVLTTASFLYKYLENNRITQLLFLGKN